MYLSDLQRRGGSWMSAAVTVGFYIDCIMRAGPVAGIDFDEKGIEAAKAKYGKYGFELLQTGDIFSARFPENSFDAVTMSHVIEHVMEPVAVVAEIRANPQTGRTICGRHAEC